jgi:hypothetical protein
VKECGMRCKGDGGELYGMEIGWEYGRGRDYFSINEGLMVWGCEGTVVKRLFYGTRLVMK